MNRLAQTSLLLALAFAAMGVSTAEAQPTRREHGSSETRPAAPVTHDSEPRRHYRRRPGPRLMMPLKVDIGVQGANTSRGFLPGVEIRAGVHWASLSPKPTNFDVGLGVFGAALIGSGMETPSDDTDDDVVYGGAYLEVAQTLSHNNWGRTWAGGRAEYFGTEAFGEDSNGFGIAGRLSAELYASGVGIEPRGIFLGTYAIGVYVEGAARGLGDDVDAIQISGGLTFRTPLVFAP